MSTEDKLGLIDPNTWTPFELIGIGLVFSVLAVILITVTWRAALATGSGFKRMCWSSSAFVMWLGIAGFVYFSLSLSASA